MEDKKTMQGLTLRNNYQDLKNLLEGKRRPLCDVYDDLRFTKNSIFFIADGMFFQISDYMREVGLKGEDILWGFRKVMEAQLEKFDLLLEALRLECECSHDDKLEVL